MKRGPKTKQTNIGKVKHPRHSDMPGMLDFSMVTLRFFVQEILE